MITEQEFEELLAFGHERRGLEVKGPGPWSKKDHRDLFGKVIRAMLGMANRQDGGLVVIGISDDGLRLEPEGLSAIDADTWVRDSIGDAVAEYADPGISFDLQHLYYQEKRLVVLHVAEFDEVPVICKKDLPGTNNRPILRAGACYVRTVRKPETSEIPAQQEMRELLDLATQKRLRWLVSQLRGAGIDLASFESRTDATLYDQQLSSFLG